MNRKFDIVVLGGGIGGYTAAIRAAQLGNSVAIVERDKLGGTCLHSGCIPSKALLHSAEMFDKMKKSIDYGIEADSIRLDFNKVQSRKETIIAQLYKGVQFLIKKNKIELFQGNGRVIGPSIFSPRSGAVAIEQPDGESETILSNNLIIATGSKPRILPGLPPDGRRVLSSDDALQLKKLPSSILIIGGGVIGVEWASMLHDFGVEVSIIEQEERILPGEDEEISKEMLRLFKKRGIKVYVKAKLIIEETSILDHQVQAVIDHKGERSNLTADCMLVSVGRTPNIQSLGLESTDIRMDKGAIWVNEWNQTTESHIYAIGDCIPGPQLAHAAAHEAIIAVEHINGYIPHLTKSNWVPRCVYSRPETASIGATEQQAIQQGNTVTIGRFPFRALGKAIVEGSPDGFVKVVVDAKTKDILGVHMIGHGVTNYIAEAGLAKLLDATPWEIGLTIRPHPSFSEAFGEAMLDVEGKAIGV